MGEKKVGKKGEEEVKGSDGSGSGSGSIGAVTVVLSVKLHCEGCAEKVKKAIKHFNGVESVKADYKTNKLTVTGKVEAEALKERVEVKTKKKVELVSPQPAKKANHGGARGGGVHSPKDDNKLDKKPKKAEENKPEEIKHQVTTVVLKTRVHCDGCAHKINKILHKYQGVEEASVDLAKDQITIKGTMDLNELLPFLNLKLKRVVEIAPPPAPKKPDGETKPNGGPNGGETLKGNEVVKATTDNSGRGVKKGKEDAKPIANGGSDADEDKKVVEKLAIAKPIMEENVSKIEVLNKMEYSGGYPYGYGAYTYSYNPHQTPAENGFVSEYWQAPPYMHTPEMFSDENPIGCSLM